ncbi:HD domain-containing protein [Herbaspirillum sp. WKF16]|uniref:HD-GYP domain-containing protein n=1 Tax=Herbaspirillum sp. WKF16 TaxID=3028312 RepID=UPI0023A95498|nr:HD domain-containing phosphohydrolase [Herbaspirillum sp. WKF16]WDZ96069.1 HD domain-containing protein [Herbaspirillum sp. WKF16]
MHRLTDGYTPSHEDRTAELCVAIARHLGLPAERIDVLHMAAQVHDIGKARIPLALLNKPGRITDEEYAVLKTHVQSGYDILRHISFPFNLAEIVWCHHEYLDGSGYPRGVTAESIPLESRILTVSDIVESMSADRPYRKSLGMDIALDEIRRLRGARLDPVVVDACLDVVGKKLWHEHAA